MKFKQEELVDREMEIAGYLLDDFSLRRIEKNTGLSKKHLDAHLKNMMEKLKANGMGDLIRLLKVLRR